MGTGERGQGFELLGRILAGAKHAVPRALRPRVGRFEAQYPPRTLEVPSTYLHTTPPSPAPSISIVTPSLNQGEYVRDAVESVISQGYPRLEYLVADGGSDDGTLEILGRYGDRIDNLESGPDGGQIAAINRDLGRARGEILGWLNSDDLLLPGALAYVGRYFAAHPEVDLVYGHRVLIDGRGEDIGFWTLPRHSPDALRWLDLVPQETAFWRRDLWRRLGGLRDRYEIAFDWDFFRRAEAAGATIVRLPRFLAAQRQHPAQKTRVLRGRASEEHEAIRIQGERHEITEQEIRVRMLTYLLRSLPYQYVELIRARLGRASTRVLPLRDASRPAAQPCDPPATDRTPTR